MDSQWRKDELWCITQTTIASISYTWTIKNLSHHKKEAGYFVTSSDFSSSAAPNVKWFLKLYPSGYVRESENLASLFLWPKFCTTIDAMVSFSLSFFNCKSGKFLIGEESPQSIEKFTNGLGWDNIIKTADLFEIAKESNDTLTILCEINIEMAQLNDSGDCVPEKIPESRLGQDFEALLNNEILSDVILIASGRKFNVHKSILAARSQVFAAKFSTEAEENNDKVELLVDVNPDILQNMLHFIYTTEIPEMTSVKLAFDLLAAADKYAIEKLKLLCEDYICLSLTVENASEALILAESHNVERLKTKATDFIQNHIAAVQKTDGWMSLFRNRQKEQAPKEDEEKK